MNSKDRAKLRGLAMKMEPTAQVGKNGIIDTLIKQIDEQINMKVYELYGLTDEEISIIENSFTE